MEETPEKPTRPQLPALMLFVREPEFDRTLGHVVGFVSAFAGERPLFANSTFSLSHAAKRLVPTLTADHRARTPVESLFTCHCGDTDCANEDWRVRHPDPRTVLLDHGGAGTGAPVQQVTVPLMVYAMEVGRILRDAIWSHRRAIEGEGVAPAGLAELAGWAAGVPDAPADLRELADLATSVAERFTFIDQRRYSGNNAVLFEAPSDILAAHLGTGKFRRHVSLSLRVPRLPFRFRAVEAVHAGRIARLVPAMTDLWQDPEFIVRQAVANLLVDLPRDKVGDRIVRWAQEEKDPSLRRFVEKYLLPAPAGAAR